MTPDERNFACSAVASVSPWRTWGRAALILYWLALFAGTHIPRLPHVVLFSTFADKVLHFAGYLGLAYIACIAWALHRPVDRSLGRSQFAIILAIIAVYGSFDELTQPLVGRTCELGDWIADVTGGMFGLICFVFSMMLLRRSREWGLLGTSRCELDI
jgi:VanZ family protein